MFWKSSPSFNIEQLSPTLPPASVSFSLSSICTFLSLGVVSLSQALCSSDEYSNSLLHLDLSKNPGVLSGEDASVRKHNPSGNKNIVCSVLMQFFSILTWSLSSTLFLFAEPVYLFVSTQLPGPFGSLRHWLLCGLGGYLMAWGDQMFTCNINIKCIYLCRIFSPD